MSQFLKNHFLIFDQQVTFEFLKIHFSNFFNNLKTISSKKNFQNYVSKKCLIWL